MTLIINTPLIRVQLEDNMLVPYVKLSEGGWIEHNAFNADSQGYIAALQLSSQVMAGAFWPKKLVNATGHLSVVKTMTQNDTKLIEQD